MGNAFLNRIMNFFKMKIYNYIQYLAFLTAILFLSQCKEPASLSAVIVTDNTEAVNDMLKTVLENSGLFEVDINSNQNPEFTDYDVVVLNLENATWTDEVKANFKSYVTSGGGVVAIGPTVTAFENWEGSSQIFGLNAGGVLRKSNKPYEYQLVNSTIEHPVINGLQKKWMHGNDYLLYKTGDLSNDAEILSTAKADSIHGGNNEYIPVLYSMAAGDGRVFVTTMGFAASLDHIESIQCVGFISTLQRGAEWAATGVVSQEVPVDFPNSVSTHYWEKLQPPTIAEILKKASTYEIGKSKKYLSDFSLRIRNSDGKPETYESYETMILEFLDSDASVDSKKYMCRELSWVGSEKSITVLEKLVNDKDLSESASYALQRLKM
jgi:type 1 glutamine amidotransferase